MTADHQPKPMYLKPARPNVYIVRNGPLQDLQDWINFMVKCGYELASFTTPTITFSTVVMVHRAALAETLADVAKIADGSSATRASVARCEGWSQRDRCLDNAPAVGELPE